MTSRPPTLHTTRSLRKGEASLADDAWERADRLLYGAAYDAHTWDGRKVYVKAYLEERFAGYACVCFEGGVAELYELLVIEDFRRRGVGDALVRRVLELARARGCHKVVLETHASLPAVALYERRGFAVEATLPRHFAGLDHVLMSVFLAEQA
jgi:ribosomal protein S18 acetylase RimI-like enzyme